jgi:hypothetical protein
MSVVKNVTINRDNNIRRVESKKIGFNRVDKIYYFTNYYFVLNFCWIMLQHCIDSLNMF